MSVAPERHGPFILVRRIGRGGMGEVHLARTPWDEPKVAAVKRLRPGAARVPGQAERFAREAEIVVRLQHPNIVATLDVGTVRDQIYVASELVLGKDAGVVADRLRERRQGAPVGVTVRLLADVLAGLAYVHGAREKDGKWLALIHRDVTPGNLLIGYGGITKLADFGLAKSLRAEGAGITAQGEILGTPNYLAPEVIGGQPPSLASDIYGLGAVVYRVLTGSAPHDSPTAAEILHKAMSQRPRRLSELRPDLPEWLVAFVHRMLEMVPTRRPFDAGLLLKRLLNEASRGGVPFAHADVGEWLRDLFADQYATDVEEAARVARMDPNALPPAKEPTVVLARGGKDRPLDPPSDEPGARATAEGDPATDELELQISGSKLADALNWEARTRADSNPFGPDEDTVKPEPRRAELDRAEGVLPEPAAAKAARRIDDDIATRIATPPKGPRATSTAASASGPVARTVAGDLGPPESFGSDPESFGSEEGTEEADHAARREPPAAIPELTTIAPSSSQLAKVPLRSIDLAPAAGTELAPIPAEAIRSAARGLLDVPESSIGVIPAPSPPPPTRPTAPSWPPIDTSAPTAPTGTSAAISDSAVMDARGRAPSIPPALIAVVLASMFLAGLIGVTLGRKLASEPETPATSVQIGAIPSDLVARFHAARAALEARAARGEAVPPRAWSLVSRAGGALIEGDAASATQLLTELEALSPADGRP